LATNTSSNQVVQTAPRAPLLQGGSAGRLHVSRAIWSIKSLLALALFVTFLFFGLERIQFAGNEKTGITHSMGKRSILYHANWVNYGRNFQVKDIPIEGVTDIAYAFFNLKDNGGGNWVIVSGDTYVSLLRERMLMVGGRIMRIRLLARAFYLRIPGLRQRKIWDSWDNSPNSVKRQTIPLL
jgi:hypothetical protein